ncbi:hypothetical protein [Limnohabitans sp. T6-5]|uniref:hypothetical protein n=1 Tax=Limnohabitans sp. T6-5 TaxID=1100724 RepID=UPI0018EEC7DB|nr:hypothetical protein [Limnohabitans sp. T6-5]
MPTTPESVGRATLVEALNPWHQKSTTSPKLPARPALPAQQPPDQTPAEVTDLPGMPPLAP